MNGSCVFADFLNAFNVYTLAVDVETLLSESLYYSSSAYRTVSYTSCRNLSFDYQLYTIESLSLLLSLSLEGSQLVSLLLKVLSEHLLGAGRSDNTLACGDKIVTTVTTLNVHDIVLVSKTDDIFFQNNLHCASSFLFHQVSYIRK